MKKKNWSIAGLSVLAAGMMLAGCGKSGKGGSSSGLADNITVALPNDVKLELVKVEPGTFTMSKRDGYNAGNETEHSVTLTKDFYIGKTEVTQAQWKAVMGNNPSGFTGDDLPVEHVSSSDARAFCKKLNEMGKAPAGWQFTLPTEAQWEYAARGGKKSRGFKYSGGNDLDEVAWHEGNSGRKTHPVASKKPNELGLYDMSGNVYEWCRDLFPQPMPTGYAKDPEFLTGNDGWGGVYAVRGGASTVDAQSCRSAHRLFAPAGNIRTVDLGFRVALIQVR